MEWRGVVNVGNLKGTGGLNYGDAAVILGRDGYEKHHQMQCSGFNN